MVSLDPNAQTVAKVADFGLARSVAPKAAGALGTWQWLAPEVLDTNNQYYDEKADVYSYAIVLWETMTRQIPFDEYHNNPKYAKFVGKDDKGEDIWLIRTQEIKQAIIKDNLRPTIPLHVSPAVRDVIEGCWAADKLNRFSFDEVVRRLSAELKVPYDDDQKIPQKLSQSSNKVIITSNSNNNNNNSYNNHHIRPALNSSGGINSKGVIYPSAPTYHSLNSANDQYILGDKLVGERPQSIVKVKDHVWVGCNNGNILIFDSRVCLSFPFFNYLILFIYYSYY